jgi:hypothetical protein
MAASGGASTDEEEDAEKLQPTSSETRSTDRITTTYNIGGLTTTDIVLLRASSSHNLLGPADAVTRLLAGVGVRGYDSVSTVTLRTRAADRPRHVVTPQRPSSRNSIDAAPQLRDTAAPRATPTERQSKSACNAGQWKRRRDERPARTCPRERVSSEALRRRKSSGQAAATAMPRHHCRGVSLARRWPRGGSGADPL